MSERLRGLFAELDDMQLCDTIYNALLEKPTKGLELFCQLWASEFAVDDSVEFWLSDNKEFFTAEVSRDLFGFIASLPTDPFNGAIDCWNELRHRAKRLLLSNLTRETILEGLLLRTYYIHAVSSKLASMARENVEKFVVLTDILCDNASGSLNLVELGKNESGITFDEDMLDEEDESDIWPIQWHVERFYKPAMKQYTGAVKLYEGTYRHYDRNKFVYVCFRQMMDFPVGYIIETGIDAEIAEEWFFEPIRRWWSEDLEQSLRDLWEKWTKLRENGHPPLSAFKKLKKEHTRAYFELTNLNFHKFYLERWGRGWSLDLSEKPF